MKIDAIGRLIEPVHEPVSLGEMRAHLRVEHHFEDSAISSALKGARAHAENYTRRAIIRQQWRADIAGTWRTFEAIEIPRPRLLEIVSLEFRNSDRDWIAVGESTYGVRMHNEPAAIWLNESPSNLDGLAHEDDCRWRLTYWAGFGELPNHVPEDLRAAIKLLGAHYYEVRQPTVTGTIVTEVPRGIDALLAPYRVPWGVQL